MNVIIKIDDNGSVSVNTEENGIISHKTINPDTLMSCINSSMMRGSVASGVLPKGCLSFVAHDNNEKDVCILHPEDKADISYYSTEYKDFPLPRLVFGFHLTKEGRISSCRLGVIADDEVIKPNTPMYRYPFSNVSGYSLCTGSNTFPLCKSLHTLNSLTYYILSMDNNNDHFTSANNKRGLEMRDLLDVIKDKSPEFYYSDILIPNGDTLNGFISGRNC